jgi:hypothetical protein
MGRESGSAETRRRRLGWRVDSDPDTGWEAGCRTDSPGSVGPVVQVRSTDAAEANLDDGLVRCGWAKRHRFDSDIVSCVHDDAH